MAGTITALKAQRGAKDRVNVELDGAFGFGLALIHALWLKTGQFLSDDEIAQLQAADTLEKAKQRAIGLIAYRPRSEREVRQRLRLAKVDAESIEEVITRLKEVGLLDDSSFSTAWVESRLRANPRGKRMIAFELKQKGVDASDIEAALADVDDADSAYRAAEKRLPRLKGLDPRERRRKLSDFLARNGFDYDTIDETLRKLDNSTWTEQQD
jgi:regulatory protein